jgi:hypothetical protein
MSPTDTPFLPKKGAALPCHTLDCVLTLTMLHEDLQPASTDGEIDLLRAASTTEQNRTEHMGIFH